MRNPNTKKMDNATRGFGFLENFLSHQRCNVANSLIADGLRNGKILDIGCGSSPFFLNKVSFKEKFGIDKVSPGNQGDIKIIKYDFEEKPILPFENNFFETVSMLAVIEHIEPQIVLNLLSEIKRILKKNGLLILTTPAAWTENLLKVMATLKLVSSVEIEEHKDAFTPEKLIRILKQSGFKEDNIETGYFECFANIWLRAQK